MGNPATDKLGRATFHHIAPRQDVRPTEREIRWLKHIERHGPQSSQYLYALTRDTHRCKDTTLRDMQKLRAGGYLALPLQQRQTAKAEFNPYVYDLTGQARDHLTDLGIAEPTVRPRGHWWHCYAVSCVTASIDIAARRDGTRYIPAHEILAIKGASLAIPVGRRRLIPDQLFALDYGGCYRVFALEVDRGTEPLRSRAARKSLLTSAELYRRVVEQSLYKQHYGLKANLLVLWVFESQARQERFQEMLQSWAAPVARAMLSQSLTARRAPSALRSPSKPSTMLYGSRVIKGGYVCAWIPISERDSTLSPVATLAADTPSISRPNETRRTALKPIRDRWRRS